jgi:hypothetical protein
VLLPNNISNDDDDNNSNSNTDKDDNFCYIITVLISLTEREKNKHMLWWDLAIISDKVSHVINHALIRK